MSEEKRDRSPAKRLFILFIILLLPTFFIREYQLIRSKKEVRLPLVEDFSPLAETHAEDKHFLFVVFTKNHRNFLEESFQSIMKQSYLNFKVVYLDQGSVDGTIEWLSEKRSENVSLIECQKPFTLHQTYYDLVSQAENETVIVHLYGNDSLAHQEVLSELNQSYQNPDVWLAYGKPVDPTPLEKMPHDAPPKWSAQKKKPRRALCSSGSLKSYYAGLLKKIEIEPDFFLSMKDENALLEPIMEFASAHVKFIPQGLYFHSHSRENQDKQKKAGRANEQIGHEIKKRDLNEYVEMILVSNRSFQLSSLSNGSLKGAILSEPFFQRVEKLPT